MSQGVVSISNRVVLLSLAFEYPQLFTMLTVETTHRLCVLHCIFTWITVVLCINNIPNVQRSSFKLIEMLRRFFLFVILNISQKAELQAKRHPAGTRLVLWRSQRKESDDERKTQRWGEEVKWQSEIRQKRSKMMTMKEDTANLHRLQKRSTGWFNMSWREINLVQLI